MSEVFLKVFNLSISASYLALCVMLLRILLGKAPKWFRTALWGLVGLRLALPVSLKSALSLIPSAETVRPEILYARHPAIDSGIPAVNSVLNPVISASMTPDPLTSVNPLQIWVWIAAIVWAAGLSAMLLYAAASYLRLRRRMKTAVRLRDNIYRSEYAASPFVLGFFRPRIYLPPGLAENTAGNVIAHERAHIGRRDHLIKPLGYLLLSVYWFNPVLWVSYVLLCRDIELACDEKVIRHLDGGARADYSQALLSCSVSRRTVAACPLAFGEVGVKERVKGVLNYKKPAFWIVAAAVIASIALAVCFLTDPAVYQAEICLNGLVYTQSGDAVQTLPAGSTEIGALKSVLRRTREHPTEQLTGTNLEETAPGCSVYQSGTQPDVIYLQKTGGPYLPFVCEDWTKQSALAWFDYFASPEELDAERELSIELPDFPGVSFRWTYTEISEVKGGNSRPLLTGMPIWNCFFSDLTGDGKPELCMTFSEGSGIIDQRVLVYDYANDQHYTLDDRGNFDYALSIENGVVTLSRYTFPVLAESVPIATGPLVLTDGMLAMSQSLFADLNRDGIAEHMTVTGDSMVQTLSIYNGDDLLWTEDAASAHTGWNALFLCRREDGDYLLRYHPAMEQGVCSYTYQLFTLEGGAEHSADQGRVDFDINFTSPIHGSFDPAAIAKLVETVNGYLESSPSRLTTSEYLAVSRALLVTDENLLYSIEKSGTLADDLWFLDQAETGFTRDETATLEENLTAYAASFGPAEALGDGVPVEGLPEDLPDEFLFASGAGGWGTVLTLRADGSFTGHYSDMEMGSKTRYVCDFSGTFGNFRKRPDGSYLMSLESTATAAEPETHWIGEDGIFCVASTPFGIEGGETFVLYPPDTPAADLPEDFLTWWLWRQGEPETVAGYSLRNVNTEQGFFAY